MNKRGTGLGFCFISAFLYAIRHISVAVSTVGTPGLYQLNFQHIGAGLSVTSMIALGIGIVYLVYAERTSDTV